MVWTYYTLVDADSNDDALAPVLSSPDVEIPIELTLADGTDVRRFPASAVNVLVLSGNKLVEQTKAPSSLKWTVLVTDCRVVTYCEKFDKGGGWVGWGSVGVAVAVTANAVSKARAAHRRKGKVLVGHMRYQWIKDVAASPKIDWRTVGKVRLFATIPVGKESKPIIIELILTSESEALSVANDIVRRASRFRLATDPQLGDHAPAFEALVNVPVREPKVPNHFKRVTWAKYAIPTAYRVVPSTAKIGIAED